MNVKTVAMPVQRSVGCISKHGDIKDLLYSDILNGLNQRLFQRTAQAHEEWKT